MPALREREAVPKISAGKELAGSLLLHALVVGGIALSGVFFRGHTAKWGD